MRFQDQAMSISAFHVREQFSRSHINNSTDVVDHVTVLLLELEAQRRRFNSPVLFFMFILAVVGVLGNVCVLFVYRVRFTKTSGNFFIMTLAVLDLLSSCLCVPFDLYDLSFPYTQSSSIACRLFRSDSKQIFPLNRIHIYIYMPLVSCLSFHISKSNAWYFVSHKSRITHVLYIYIITCIVLLVRS